MPRIELDGEGFPIPQIALPPFGSDSDLPPTVLTFTDNADFPVADYRALGFTHFEAWCVGAAGGRGGDATTQPYWAYTEIYRPVPLSVWNLWQELKRITDFYTSGEWDHIYFYGPNPAMPNDGAMTIVQAEEYFNPTHQLPFRLVSPVVLYPDLDGLGGGGGGGGFHKVVGLLADLPDVASVVVGKAGSDAGYGQVHQHGVWTPDIYGDPTLAISTTRPTSAPYPAGRQAQLYNYFDDYLWDYPTPHPSFSNPVKGEDGGASSFADDIAQASGGEGGDPGMSWDGTKFVIDGDGGDGGIGGSSSPGGGGAGSTAEGVNGSDGIWVPETGIGAGGGGGKGGRAPESTSNPFFPASPPIKHLATAGGQGSYSFGDTSVYGARQFRQPWTYLKPVTSPGDGTYTYVPTSDSGNLVTPGGGGGARPFPNLKYGGRGVGFSPDGIVVVRLTKIT